MTDQELDKCMAVVMGWHLVEQRALTPRDNLYWADTLNKLMVFDYDWSPTESISDAMQVVERIHETWTFSKRRAFLGALQDVVSEGISGLTERGQKIAWPDLFFYITPKAICLAAERVMEL